MERLWNRNYLRAWGANFTLFFSFMLVVPLLPIYLQEEFCASKDVIGTVLSGYTAVALLTRATSGYLVDTYPRKQILVLGFVLLTAFFAGYIVAGSLLLFAIIRTLHGFPFGISTVANSTVAIDVLPASRRAEGIGYYGLSNNVATAISPSVGLWLYDTFHNFDILFCASMFMALLGVLCVSGIDMNRSMEEMSTEKTKSIRNRAEVTTSAFGNDQKQSVKKRSVTMLNRLYLLPAWSEGLSIAGFSFAYGVVSTYVAIYGREEIGITGGSGLFFALLASGLILSRLVGSRTLRQGKILRNASIGSCISSLGYLLFALLHNEAGYYGAALLIGLGNGHLWPAFQTMFINLSPVSKRGTANASLLTSWDLGVGLGVICGGFLIEHFSYNVAFWCAWLLETMGVVFYFVYVRKSYLTKKLR